MTNVFASILLAGVFALFGQSKLQKSVSEEKIGSVLSCLQNKLGLIEPSPPRRESHSFLVRYFYGVLTPGYEKENELQLIVYAQGDASATLYRVYFEQQNHRPVIFIGEWGTLKKHNGQMIPDDVPGGVASYLHIKQLLRVVSRKPALTIPDRYVKSGTDGCVYEP